MLSCKVTGTEALSFGLTWLTAVTLTLAPAGRIDVYKRQPSYNQTPCVRPRLFQAAPIIGPELCTRMLRRLAKIRRSFSVAR